jgi:uncharacterized protein YdeI (YjbR/CyaY-like superfamily)
MMQTTVEGYLTEGCGRCPLGGTPDCKVHAWSVELHALRGILSESGLTETVKWGVPCYTLNGKNVLLLSAFKNHCAISFFKGALLKDDTGLLSTPGPNSQASRLLKFTSPDAVEALREATHDFIQQAIAIENAGLQIELHKSPEPWPEELQETVTGFHSLKRFPNTILKINRNERWHLTGHTYPDLPKPAFRPCPN